MHARAHRAAAEFCLAHTLGVARSSPLGYSNPPARNADIPAGLPPNLTCASLLASWVHRANVICRMSLEDETLDEKKAREEAYYKKQLEVCGSPACHAPPYIQR